MAWRIKIRLEMEGYRTRTRVYRAEHSPSLTLKDAMEAFGEEVARVSRKEGRTVAAEALISLEIEQPTLKGLTP